MPLTTEEAAELKFLEDELAKIESGKQEQTISRALGEGQTGGRAVGKQLLAAGKNIAEFFSGGSIQPTPEQKATAAELSPPIDRPFKREGAVPPKKLSEMLEREVAVSETEPGAVGQILDKATLPLAGGILASFVGLGPIGVAASSMAGELFNQILGKTKASLTEIGIAGVPIPAARGLKAVAKSTIKGAAGFALPSKLRRAGVNRAKEIMAPALDSGVIYADVGEGLIKTGKMAEAIGEAAEKVVNKATPSKVAFDRLVDLDDWLRKLPQRTHAEVLEELQTLRAVAKQELKTGDVTAGRALFEASDKMLGELTKLNPRAAQAANAFRREQASKAMSKAFRKSNPADAIDNILDSDKLIAGAFSPDEIVELRKIADDIGDYSTGTVGGAGNRFIQAIVKPLSDFAATKPGRAIVEQIMSTPGMTAKVFSDTIAVLSNQLRRHVGGDADFLDPEVDE